MAENGKPNEVALVAVSGISWPTQSRRYLIKLVKEAAHEAKAKFIIVAGHLVDGKHLDTEFKGRLKEQLAGLPKPRPKGDDLAWEKARFADEFVDEYARQLSEFLPRVGINWHIAIAERIYDGRLGARVIEKLADMRPDVRIIGNRLEDGFYDREPKVPVQFPGFEEIRVIVPHRSPWFSKVISNLMQRLMSAFAPRTFSPKPPLIITGCTGTAVHLPSYDGVPTVSAPVLRKLLESQATEHMVGATVIRAIANGKNGVRIVNGVHNFRTAVFLEKRMSVPTALPTVQQAVLHALIPSDASFKAVLYRTNAAKMLFRRKKAFTEPQIRTALDELIKAGTVAHSKNSNRYGINEELRKNADITLASLNEGSREIKHVVYSCLHGGATKTLYFTVLNDLPKLALDADALIENGDLLQGISHNYQTNGELLPIANGVDKQEILGAHIRATVLLEIFKNRLAKLRGKYSAKEVVGLLKACLIRYLFNAGNHDKWGFWNKQTLILQMFEDKLRSLVLEGVLRACQESGVAVTVDQVQEAVNASIIRVGESRMVELDGITVGIKHPHKSRTITKSSRIQEVANFIWQRFGHYVGTVAKSSKGFSIAYVANFHEAAAAHITKFGQTVLGVMTGAYMYDTEFENHMDKVVDYGPCVVHARFDAEGRLLYSETEFVNRIDDEDREFVTSDRLDSKQILMRCIKLMDRVGLKLPWR